MEYCCEDFKEAVEECNIIDRDTYRFEPMDLGSWWIGIHEWNPYQEEHVYHPAGNNPIKYCPWCMHPIIYDENMKL